MGDFGAALTVTPLFLFSLKCFIMQSPTAPETKVKEEELFGSSRLFIALCHWWPSG